MTTVLRTCTKTFTKAITGREPAFDRDDQNKDELLEFIIYPNPNQGDFSVNLEFASQTNIDMKLFSLASNALLQHINLYDKKPMTSLLTCRVHYPQEYTSLCCKHLTKAMSEKLWWNERTA